ATLLSHLFPLDHGDRGEIDCLTCHTETYLQYTCDSCHKPAEMTREHNKEGIFDITNRCVECHPDGREAEDDD
ncbi:MAG: hypothetical protein ACE5GO_12520, partial [Anaerolineales bacterium]